MSERIIMSKDEQLYWWESGPAEEGKDNNPYQILGIMRQGRVARMTNEVFKQFIELFDDMRIGNNYYNLNCIYNPYTKQDEEPYWLCSLRWIPHELHKHIVDINFDME